MRSKHSPKPKIISKNKSYAPSDSPFYKLSNKKRLSVILGVNSQNLSVISSDDNYRVFLDNNRKIQAPTFKLERVHTRIASLLVRLGIPDYLHSGVKGRSNITNAKVHFGYHPVLTVDIKKFFPSVSKKSIYHFFSSTLSASPDVSGVLAEICTYNDHVPTGSRISMPLAYWANRKLFSSLHIYCEEKNVNMSVFVDDITFSGINVTSEFQAKIERIVINAGMNLNKSKTKLYSANTPKLITGVVIDGFTAKVRHKHYKRIYELFCEIPSCENDEQLCKLQNRLVGSLNAAGQIDKRNKSKARDMTKNGIKKYLKT